MATIVADETGNWSAGGTWTGGTPPGVGDVAQTGNFIVTIDQDITVTTLNPTGSGYFLVTAGGRTINANVVAATTYTGGSFRCEHTTGTVTLNGNVTAAAQPGSSNINAGTLVVNGTATGGSGSTAYGIWNFGTGTATVNEAIGGTSVSAYGAFGTNAGGTMRVKMFKSGATGVSPIGGFVFITEDAANNTFKMRTADDSAEVTLVHSSLAGGGGGPVIGSRIIRGLGAV